MTWHSFIFFSLLIFLSCTADKPKEDREKPFDDVFVPQVRYNMLVNEFCSEDGVVRKNQQFQDMLGGHPISARAIRTLNTIPRKEFDFRSIRSGDRYTLFTHLMTDSVQALVLVHDPIRYTIFHFGDSLSIERCANKVDTLLRTASGVITKSLSHTMDEMGISPTLTNRFVDIFAWVVDFTYLQKGDRFKILYEELSVENKPFGIGKIHGIYFNHNQQDDYAIPFDQGGGEDYFDVSGKSLRKALLKYPIEFTRISSRYSLSRFHPVLKVNRPHFGTDLSAATGTPIRSVGDGTVVESGYKGGNGNYVRIRHNDTYTTGYLHMSRIANGVRAGVRVRQGEVIGYVGQTGWATGPHLCYRFWKNGVQVDALRVELPPAQPVKEGRLAQFKIRSDSVIQALAKIPEPVAQQPGQGEQN